MGACLGSSDQDTADRLKKNRSLDAEMAALKKNDGEKVKLLLLGAGESGKL